MRPRDQWVGLKLTSPGLAGFGIIILGLMLGLTKAVGDDAIFWVFLDTALIPVALGVLIMVAGNIVSRLGNRDN